MRLITQQVVQTIATSVGIVTTVVVFILTKTKEDKGREFPTFIFYQIYTSL